MLAAFQEAFVQLAADAGLRRSFGREPRAALARFELAPEERAALCAIPFEQLESYARSLVAKRWAELARVVPLALRVTASLSRRHRAWALEHPAQVMDGVLSPGAAEGLRALGPLRAGLIADEREVAYAADLFAFEVLRAASREDGTPRELRSRFALVSIAEDVQRGLLPVDPEPQPTLLRFERAHVRWRPA
jgi:hypothetical protein